MRWNKEDVGSLRHPVVPRLRRIQVSETKGGQLHWVRRSAVRNSSLSHADPESSLWQGAADRAC